MLHVGTTHSLHTVNPDTIITAWLNEQIFRVYDVIKDFTVYGVENDFHR